MSTNIDRCIYFDTDEKAHSQGSYNAHSSYQATGGAALLLFVYQSAVNLNIEYALDIDQPPDIPRYDTVLSSMFKPTFSDDRLFSINCREVSPFCANHSGFPMVRSGSPRYRTGLGHSASPIPPGGLDGP